MEDSNPAFRISVHQALGGGLVADVLLWRRWYVGAVILTSATNLWYLFERAGYSILSFVANVLFLLVVILFIWAKSAKLLNRPLPPLPDLEISEKTVGKVADELQVWINQALSIAHDIVIGRNYKLFLKIAGGLWLLSFLGSQINFLTLLYVGLILSLSVPFIYDRYQHHIDEKFFIAIKIILTEYKKIEEIVQRKLPLPSKKEKKMH